VLVDRDGTIHPHTDAPALRAADGMHPAYQVVQSIAAAWAASPEQAQRQAEQIVLALAEGDLLVFAGASESGTVSEAITKRSANRLMKLDKARVEIRDVVPVSAFDPQSTKAYEEAMADPDLRECLENGWLTAVLSSVPNEDLPWRRLDMDCWFRRAP
jgi:hypothetical protein